MTAFDPFSWLVRMVQVRNHRRDPAGPAPDPPGAMFRRLTAALAHARALRADLEKRIAGSPYFGPDDRAIAVLELRQLAREVPVGDRWDDIRSFIDQSAGRIEMPDTSPGFALMALSAMERMLEAAREAREDHAPDHPAAPLPDGDGAVAASPSKPAEAFTPSEAALLAGITEKFYASWMFRILGLTIVAAAGLAVAGNIAIGDKAYDLRGELIRAGDSARQDIVQQQALVKTSLQDMQAAAARQVAAMDDAQHAAQNSLQDFKSGLDKTRPEVAKLAADAVVKQIDGKVGELSGRLQDAADAGVAKLDAATQVQLTAANDALHTLDGKLAALQKAAGEIADKLERLHVDALAGEINAARSAIAAMPDVKAAAETLNAAVVRAQSGAVEVQGFAASAKASADTASGSMTALTRAAGVRERALGALESTAETLDKRAKAIGDRFTELERVAPPAAPPGHPDALAAQLLSTVQAGNAAREAADNARQATAAVLAAETHAKEEAASLHSGMAQLADRVTALEHQIAQPPKPVLPQPQAAVIDRPLSNAEWRQVEAALQAKGFQTSVDGIKGPKTCVAIRRFQLTLRAGQTGTLTPEQITALLGGAAGASLRLIDEQPC
jgi:hypothetical protein